MTEESKDHRRATPTNRNPLWGNRWQVIRTGNGAVTVLCAHRYEIAAAACAWWRDLRTDTVTIGTWHDHRPTPDRNQP